MRKRMKSLLLVLCMLITMIPTTFLADEVTEEPTTNTIEFIVYDEKEQIVDGTHLVVSLCESLDGREEVVIAESTTGRVEYEVTFTSEYFLYNEIQYTSIKVDIKLPDGYENGSGDAEWSPIYDVENGSTSTMMFVEDLSDGDSRLEESPYTQETVVSNDDYIIEKGYYDSEIVSTTIDFATLYNEKKVLEALTYVSKEDKVRVYLWCDAETFPVFSSEVLTELAKIEAYVQIYNEKTELQLMFNPIATQEDFYMEYHRSENATLIKKLEEAGVKTGYILYVVSCEGKQGALWLMEEVEPGIFTISEENATNYFSEEKYIYYYDEARDLFVSGEDIGRASFFDNEEWEATLDFIIYKSGDYVVTDKPLSESLTNANVGTEIKTDEIVEKDVLEDAKENGTSVNVQVEASQKSSFVNWLFDKIETALDFIPTVQVDAVIEEVEKKVEELTELAEVKYTTVSFDFDGVLPGKAEVTLDIKNSDLGKNDIKEGQKVYLYYFNPQIKEFELVDSSAIKNGFATFSMAHCSDYIITTEELPTKVEEIGPNTDTNTEQIPDSEEKAPDTGDNTFVFGYVAILLAGVAIIVNEFLLKKKVK